MGRRMLDTTGIDAWLADYLKAWRSDDPADIAALFEPDARYFTAPWRDPYVGSDAIVRWWVGQENSELPWSVDYDVVATQSGTYVVRGVTNYPLGTDRAGVPEVYDNIWLVPLGGSGGASEFTEYWMLRD
jgi:hypothetical protein